MFDIIEVKIKINKKTNKKNKIICIDYLCKKNKIDSDNSDGSDSSERELLIAQAFETPEGRASLARTMIEPLLRRQLNYQSIGRDLLIVEELPIGASAYITEEAQMELVTNNINANVTGRQPNNVFRGARFNVDINGLREQDEIQREEDRRIFDSIDAMPYKYSYEFFVIDKWK